MSIQKYYLHLLFAFSCVYPNAIVENANPFLDVYEASFPVITWSKGDGRLEIGMVNRTESFYARSLALLSDSYLDQVLYFQNTTDLKFYVTQGDWLRSRTVIRNKYKIGDPGSLGQTSESSFKIADATAEGNHSHFIGKLFFWIRENWAEIYLNKVLGLECDAKHYFKVGIFSFALGRGISLGDAYAVSPGIVGFYSSNVIDQYAFGGLLHGDVVRDFIEYDAYFSILRNYSGTFKDNNAKIYAQQLGNEATPWRGFGHINFLFASRLTATFKNPLGCGGVSKFEPYVMINHDPEQKIDFDADAESKLATLGMAVDYEGSLFEWGIETAANFGKQTVHAWDNNDVKLVNKNGVASFEYTKVFAGDPATGASKALVTSANKAIVAAGQKGALFNGTPINGSTLYNGLDRFTPRYTNEYQGVMFVADATVKIEKDVKLSTAFAFASGDVNPNKDFENIGESLVDGNYQGFIPFQSTYSGRTVASVFFLGSGKIVRPSLVTASPNGRDRFASADSGFTNLILYGVGSDIRKPLCGKKARFRPNILFGWQDFATEKFDVEKKIALKTPASKYLGFELNFFGEIELIKNLKAFLVTGIFFPGSHFKDVKGKPTSADTLENLNNPVCGDLFGKNSAPILADNKAFLLNVGLEYFF